MLDKSNKKKRRYTMILPSSVQHRERSPKSSAMIRRSTSTNCIASVPDPSKCPPEESSSCGGSYCLKPKRTDTSWEGACRKVRAEAEGQGPCREDRRDRCPAHAMFDISLMLAAVNMSDVAI